MSGLAQRRGDAEEGIECAIEIHTNLGPGLLKSVYEALLEKKLSRYGFSVQRQVLVPVRCEEMTFDEGFRADLKLLNLEVGLLINFGAPTIKEGLHRIVNGFKDSPLRLSVPA